MGDPPPEISFLSLSLVDDLSVRMALSLRMAAPPGL
jgi:hypothetical protein